MWQHFVGHSYKEGTSVKREERLQPFVFTNPFVCKCMCRAQNLLRNAFPFCMWVPDSELRSSDLVACVPTTSAIFPAPYTLGFAFHFPTTCFYFVPLRCSSSLTNFSAYYLHTNIFQFDELSLNTLMFRWCIYFAPGCWNEPFSLISGSGSLFHLCFHHSAQDSASEIHCVNLKEADLAEIPLSPLVFVKFSE